MYPSIRILRHFAPLALVITATLTVIAGGANEVQDQTKGGPVFKIPDGYMKAPLTNFRGLMMLNSKNAAGMFVTYPNDNETTEALSKRLIDFIGPMFIHDKGGPQADTIWSAKPLLSHPGDGEGKATLNTYSDTIREVRIAIYERTGGVRPFLYGYFAMRHKDAKDDDGKFLDDQGKGVKAFDKLWKSFPK